MLVSMAVRPETSPLTISSLFFVPFFFNVENLIRDTQTIVISLPDVHSFLDIIFILFYRIFSMLFFSF